MNAITYFKLRSPYVGDVTKNCALTGCEVDNNFYTLEGRDIKSIEVDEGKIVVNLMNGDILSTENVTEGCIKELSIDFDETNGILTITKDGITETIDGFITKENFMDLIPKEDEEEETEPQPDPLFLRSVSTDGTIIGNGIPRKPLGLSPSVKTGQYRPVKKIIDTTNNESLPVIPDVFPGDRFLTIENISDYGMLYNYNGLKKIACALRDAQSPWRIPTKEDWDDMLNAVEPNEEYRNHNDERSNKFLGKFAGKLLKSVDLWKEDDDFCDENETVNCFNSEDHECVNGNHSQCHPDYCGEYGTCCHRRNIDSRGVDQFGFKVKPAGYANEAKDFMYFGERAYFWTASNHDYRDAYIKSFTYNKSSVLQDIMAADNYMSVRLVKDYNGENHFENEEIIGNNYSTVLMPSITKGSTIWTSINLSFDCCDCNCRTNHIYPNNGEDLDFVKKYYINEFIGKCWLKKEVMEGESVVVIGDNNTCIEYRVINGELKNIEDVIYNNVIETITPQLEDINEKIDTIDNSLQNEIERATAKDEELENAVNNISERLTTAETNIATNTQDISDISLQIEQINSDVEAIGTALQQEIERATTKDEELENAIAKESLQRQTDVDSLIEEVENLQSADERIEAEILTQEGTEFDKNTGVLTLKSKGGTNDIEVQFNFNFGTF